MHSAVDGWFSLSGQRTRASFALASVLSSLVIGTAAGMLYFFGFDGDTLATGLLLTSLVGAWAGLALIGQRLRDAGYSGKWALLAAAPALFFGVDNWIMYFSMGIIFLVLCILPGTQKGTPYQRKRDSRPPLQLR
jgi:uncharacterized membrane protein YhaH (DUF805 family)